MKKFTKESMFEVISYFNEELKKNKSIKFEVLNPMVSKDLFSGESIFLEKEYIYRSFKTWSDLAETLHCKLYVVQVIENKMILEFESLNKNSSFHNEKITNFDDKYGEKSTFFRINKNEDATFLSAYIKALQSVKIGNKKTILNLGINKADEFKVIKNLISKEDLSKIKFYGVDFSKSAIQYAKNRFSNDNFKFFCHDINRLEELNLPKMDCIISIGTLQSSSLNFKVSFMNIVQNYLKKGGSIILGFPNCRWIDNEVIYGAKVKNYSYSEQSVLYNDVIFCKKYLQQKKYRVTLTGKNYVFLTATFIK